MTLVKLYELLRSIENPFFFYVINPQLNLGDYKVVCNGETISGIQVDHKKGQVILKTYKQKAKEEK